MIRSTVAALVGLSLLLLAACPSDDPTGPRVGARYVLASVQGEPLPAIVDSLPPNGGPTRVIRIVARSIDFLSADSAQYTVVHDFGTRTTDGGVTPIELNCSSIRLGWRRGGSSVLLDFTVLQNPSVPIDTLRVSGRRLLQRLRPRDPAEDSYALSYRTSTSDEGPFSCEIT